MDSIATDVLRSVASFRRDPDAFLHASSTDEDAFVQQTLVVLASDGRDDATRIHILILWQEFAALLFHGSKRSAV